MKLTKNKPLLLRIGTLLSAVFLASCGGNGATTAGDTQSYISVADTTAVVAGIDTSTDLTQEGGSAMIAAGQRSTINLYGTNLQLGLTVTLGGQTCLTHDLSSYDNENEDSGETELYADCPAMPEGNHRFVVTDNGQPSYSGDIAVVPASQLAANRAVRLAAIRPTYGSIFDSRARSINPFGARAQAVAPQATPGAVTGVITFDAPATNNTGANAGSLNYNTINRSNARGVVVKLLDAANNDAVLATTATDSAGVYTFSNVPATRNLKVQVLAQISQTRAQGVTTGPQYNFMVRNNTAVGEVKPFHKLESAQFTSSISGDVMSINAGLGFNSAGAVTGTRESAAFSILDVVYNAVNGIQTANPNVTLPDLNIYWSTDNRSGDGDKTAGLIGTSHFSSSGAYPGVFILGKADVDTDEFDRGVIGHEFGHYLQYAASYDDSPGGAHSSNEFKDAALAYGEGFGTAIGGLLSGSQYYADSSGVAQSGGFATDLAAVPSDAKGFYAENSVGYLLYKLGTSQQFGGFTTFWKATTALTSGYESATVFNFLRKFVEQSGGAATESAVLALANAVNIKTVSPLGILDSSINADSAINAAASLADDLEALYKTMAPIAPSGSDAQALTTTPATFCLNNRLRGATGSNGLGSIRRFTFTSPYTGTMGARLLNQTDQAFPEQVLFLKVRDGNTGKNTNVYFWAGSLGRWNVTQGANYTVTVQVVEPTIFSQNQGNLCGNKFTLWQAPALSL